MLVSFNHFKVQQGNLKISYTDMTACQHISFRNSRIATPHFADDVTRNLKQQSEQTAA